MAWLSIDLFGTARNLLGRLLVRVVLLSDDHTEPEEMQRNERNGDDHNED